MSVITAKQSAFLMADSAVETVPENGESESTCRIEFIEHKVGIAKSRRTGAIVLFKRGKLKLSTKYRVWPVAGDDTFLELDPSEWRERYCVVSECKACEEQAPV